jgi:SAM-dependent methyltransferase
VPTNFSPKTKAELTRVLEGIALLRGWAGDFDKKFVDRFQSGDALDAACGTGRYAQYLAGRGHRVVGVDSSPDMLDRARARVPSGEFLPGDLRQLPLPDNCVDLVVSALSQSHVPTLAPVMAEFTRVLRPGGHLVISDAHHEIVFRGSVPHALGPTTNPAWSRPTGIRRTTTFAPRSRPDYRSDAARNRTDPTTTSHSHSRRPNRPSAAGTSGPGRC